MPRVPNLPPEPSARQIAEHELTGHAVYRSWCRHCVASKGRAHAHSSREEGELPEIGIDYGFFGRDKEDVLPILCVKCRNSSWTAMPPLVRGVVGVSFVPVVDSVSFMSFCSSKSSVALSSKSSAMSSVMLSVVLSITVCKFGITRSCRRRVSVCIT